MLIRNAHSEYTPTHLPKCRQITTLASADRAGLLSNISGLHINNSVFIHALFLLFCCVFLLFFCSSDCVKGYYKRAKAHAAVWNEKDARRDFNMVAHLDITLASLVNRELKALSERMKEKYWEEKEKYWDMLEKKETKNEEVEEKRQGEDKEKQEDTENVTTGSKDEVREKKATEDSPSKGEVGGNNNGTVNVAPAEGAGNKEEASSSEIKPNVSEKTEGKDWQQMLRLVMLLQNEGNFLVKEKHFQEASVKFKEAIEYVDFLLNTVSRTDYTVKLKPCTQIMRLNNEMQNKAFCCDDDCPDVHPDLF